MKRIALKLLLFLLLGAILNVAVAWGCALCSPLSRNTEKQDDGGRQYLISKYQVDGELLGTRSYSGLGRFRVFVEDESLKWTASTANPAHPRWVYLDRTGWPMRALAGKLLLFTDAEQTEASLTWKWWPSGLRDTYNPSIARIVPLEPLWPGFAINTIFYAAIIWLPFGAFELRRRRRIKRGLCPACAYPMGSSVVCTECGTAVKQ